MNEIAGRHSRNGFLCKQGLLEVEEAHRQFSLEGLAPRGEVGYLDSRVSVSGVRRDETHWDNELLEEQFRRNFHNGV